MTRNVPSLPAALALAALANAAPLPVSAEVGSRAEAIYQSHCAACHAPENIMVSSPKLNNAAQWRERLAPGLDHVIDRAVKGFGAMPPMGLCDACSRDDIEAAIRFMAAPALDTPIPAD
ncbi:c-type cytochrome [Marinovum sp.]|uniref:c-type cytochrome n=1 Tax=Marinovum sp. TaxID=2024839 RepID=UPI003A9308F2